MDGGDDFDASPQQQQETLTSVPVYVEHPVLSSSSSVGSSEINDGILDGGAGGSHGEWLFTIVALGLITIPLIALIGSTFLKLVFVHNVGTISARYSFTTVFTTSSLMFVLVLADMAGVFVYRQKLLSWSLAVSLLNCVIVVPFVAVYGLLGDIGFPPKFLAGNSGGSISGRSGGGGSDGDFITSMTGPERGGVKRSLGKRVIDAFLNSSLIEPMLRNLRSKTIKAVVTVALLCVVYYFTMQALPSDDLVYVDTTTRAPKRTRGRGTNDDGGGVLPPPPPSEENNKAIGNHGNDGGKVVMGPSPPEVGRRLFISEQVLSGAAYIGVAFMAVLGGFAAVATPLAYLRPFANRNNREESKQVLDQAETKFKQLMEASMMKKVQLANLKATVRARAAEAAFSRGGGAKGPVDGAASSSGWGSWFKSSVLGYGDSATSADTKDMERMQTEIEALDQIVTSLYLQVSEAEENSMMADFGKSARALLFATLGIVLSFYCIGKVLLTIFNLFFRRFSTVDPITRFFTIVVTWTALDLNVEFMVDRVALGFNAVMTLSAVRGLLIMIFRLTTKHLAGIVSPNTTVHFFTVFVGLHFIAMLLLMRVNLPSQNRGALTEVIGPLPFYYYHRWHDALFVISAIGTAVVKKLMQD